MQIVSRSRRSMFIAALSLIVAAHAWAAEVDLAAKLPTDPNIVIGALPNGMKYWIRVHKTPPGKVGLWMHVATGSINEDDNQRGLAHFLEHMAFNGSENFPAGTLIKYFESIGLKFGQHQNAFTSFDQTTYILSLPNPRSETIGKGMQCLSDFAYKLLLLPEKIETERGVILEEMRARKGAQQRIVDKLLPIVAPGSRLAERMPIGKEDIIKGADKQRFVDYYSKWYRPENTTLLVVGDIESVPAIEKMIAENFGAWKAAATTPGADPGITPYTGIRAAVITDPELSETAVSAANIAPLKKMTTVGDYRERVVNGFACWIVNRRMSELVEKGKAPFQSASFEVSPFLNVAQQVQAEASGKPDQWEPMMNGLLTEMKRAREFGFLEQELEDAKKDLLSSSEQASRTESTWDKSAFLGRMNGAVSEGRTPMSEAQRLEVLKTIVPGVTLAEVSEAFKKQFASDKRLLLVTMPEKADVKVPSDKEIMDAAARAEAATVVAAEKKERPKSLLEKEPQPGKVASQDEEKDLKILSATLDNGVRVHLRSMDFKKNEVQTTITIAGGKVRETAANRGVTDVAGLALSQIASQKLSSTTIREMMTGLNVAVGGGEGDDSLMLTISGSPKDLEEGFKLAHLVLTEPKIEDSAVKLWKEQMAQFLEMRKTSVEAQLMEKVQSILTNDDPRTKSLTAEQVNGLSVENSQKWLEQILKNGPIELAIVGDIDRDKALALAQKYFGSLPRREQQDTELVRLRKIESKKGPQNEIVKVETITPRAVVVTGWRGANWVDVKERRVLQLAAQILSSRLLEEIREKRSLTYSIQCMAHPARVYENSGLVGAFFTADPDKADEAAKIAREMMETFAKEGPTDKEMETVRKQFKNQLEETLKEPSFWLGVLSDLEYRGTKLSDVKEVQEKMLSYTKEEMMEVLKKYFCDERRLQVIALPAKK